MAATVEVIKQYGTSPGSESSDLSVSGIALKSVDDVATSPASAPVEILSTGTNYSYESWVKFKVTNMGGSSLLDTFQIWGSGSQILSGTVKITVNTAAQVVYETPDDAQSDEPTFGGRDDFKNHGSGSKISIAGTLTAIGHTTDFAVFQLVVFDTASPGSIPEQTVFYSYQES